MPPIGFSFSDLFSLDPAAMQRVMSSPYFIYIFLSCAGLAVLLLIATKTYRANIVQAIRWLGWQSTANRVDQWLERMWSD